MNSLAIMLGTLMFQAKKLGKKVFTDESGEVNIVAIVVLIGIAVVLALFFKDQIKNLLNTLFETITGKATNAVTQE